MLDVENEDDAAFLTDMSMHVAAFRPSYITSNDVPEAFIAKEKEIAAVQLAGKPANMIENILKGKINKWFTEVCFVNQPWIKDDKTSLVKLKPNMVVKQMARWEVGEEI
jgi:elongation factor Ts